MVSGSVLLPPVMVASAIPLELSAAGREGRSSMDTVNSL